ncbi:MAG TPA: endo-1,4-beta-xylanase [Polyangiaceae bacterium]
MPSVPPLRLLAVACVLAGACTRPAEPVAPPRLETKPIVAAVYTEHPRPRVLDLRTGKSLPLRSSGIENGDAWVLDENGYAGVFLEVPAAGTVQVTVTAAGHADQNVAPHMNVVVGALSWPFDVRPATSDYTSTLELAAGTYFVRIELVNDTPETNRQLELVSVRAEGGRLLSGNRDEFALAAADTYIQNHRRGRARVGLAGATPGSKVRVELKRHAFRFGADLPFADNRFVPEQPPNPDGDAAKYQRMLLGRFNTAVLSDAAAWSRQEEKRDRVTPAPADRAFGFAEQHGLSLRMHALLEDAEQPAWLGSTDPKKASLLLLAKRGDARAKAELDAEIGERIEYAVKARAGRYAELDVIDESLHRPRYYEIYGAAGLADIFNRAARAVQDAGARTRLYLNESGLLQWSRDPQTAGSDPYANWYRRHAEAIVRAGGKLDGLGIRYHADGRAASELGAQAHGAARAFAVLQNLSSTGLRLALTDFAVGANTADAERAATILDETLRLVFGTPQADTFVIQGIWARAVAASEPASVLFDANGQLTPVGRRFDALLKAWSTELEVVVDADGTLAFDGFYGDYTLSFGATKRDLTLVPGKSKYSL